MPGAPTRQSTIFRTLHHAKGDGGLLRNGGTTLQTRVPRASVSEHLVLRASATMRHGEREVECDSAFSVCGPSKWTTFVMPMASRNVLFGVQCRGEPFAQTYAQ
jgi:hypothetical protein